MGFYSVLTRVIAQLKEACKQPCSKLRRFDFFDAWNRHKMLFMDKNRL